jgi:hypothetical protein
MRPAFAEGFGVAAFVRFGSGRASSYSLQGPETGFQKIFRPRRSREKSAAPLILLASVSHECGFAFPSEGKWWRELAAKSAT